MKLVDFKVRITNGGTEAVTRVIIDSEDAQGRRWSTVGVSANIVDASFEALLDAIQWKLIRDEMRLQWWADHLADLDADLSPSGEVAEALQPLLRKSPGLSPVLTAIAEARRQDCWPEPFPNRAALWLYLEQTAGNLMWAAAWLLGASERDKDSVRAYGRAVGLANWLHARPDLIRHKRLELSGADAVLLGDLAKEGLREFRAARSALKDVDASARPALWAGWATMARLKAAAADPDRIDEGRLGPPEAYRAPALLWRTLTRAI
jgi:phytoene synthase